MTVENSKTAGEVAFADDRHIADPSQDWTRDEWSSWRVKSEHDGRATAASILSNTPTTLEVGEWSGGVPDAGAAYEIVGRKILPIPVDEIQAIDAIERDRRAREREMLLLFLIIFGTATRHAQYAIRIGHDPAIAARDVIVGNARLGLRGLAPDLGNLMALAHSDGYRRTDLLAGQRPTLPKDGTLPGWGDYYRGAADRASQAMADTISDRINEGITEAPEGADAREIAQEVGRYVKEHGYGKENPYLLETVAERIVIDANGGGQWNGWQRPEMNERLKGFVHRSVLDSGTTSICRCRDGFSRPKTDQYWLKNFPSLHFSCRSIVIPLFKDREWSTVYPTIPPAPGFGIAPWAFMTYGRVG